MVDAGGDPQVDDMRIGRRQSLLVVQGRSYNKIKKAAKGGGGGEGGRSCYMGQKHDDRGSLICGRTCNQGAYKYSTRTLRYRQ